MATRLKIVTAAAALLLGLGGCSDSHGMPATGCFVESEPVVVATAVGGSMWYGLDLRTGADHLVAAWSETAGAGTRVVTLSMDLEGGVLSGPTVVGEGELGSLLGGADATRVVWQEGGSCWLGRLLSSGELLGEAAMLAAGTPCRTRCSATSGETQLLVGWPEADGMPAVTIGPDDALIASHVIPGDGCEAPLGTPTGAFTVATYHSSGARLLRLPYAGMAGDVLVRGAAADGERFSAAMPLSDDTLLSFVWIAGAGVLRAEADQVGGGRDAIELGAWPGLPTVGTTTGGPEPVAVVSYIDRAEGYVIAVVRWTEGSLAAMTLAAAQPSSMAAVSTREGQHVVAWLERNELLVHRFGCR